MSEAISHRTLQNLACRRLYDNYDIVVAEFTPYQSGLAFDVLAFSRLKKEIRVIECKASRADFLADTKWERYLPYSTHVAFLGPQEVFSKQELPSDIGIIRPRWVRRRTWKGDEEKLEWYYERGCQRLHDVVGEEYVAVLEGMLWQYMQCLWRCPPPRDGCLKMRLKESTNVQP